MKDAKHVYITAGVLAVLAVSGFLFVLWLRGHDQELRGQVQTQNASVDVKIQQENITKLTDGLKAINDRAESDRQANDAKFDAMRTMMQQAVNMAQTMGMKQPPVIIQPGTNQALPQGGVYLNPGQVQSTHDYEKVCEDCKIENRRLKAEAATKDGVIAAKNEQLRAKDAAIKQLNDDLGHGLRRRLADCAARAGIGATAGTVGAAMSSQNPLQPNKSVGKAAGIGAGLGIFSCLAFNRK